jgi:hypothetical protein
MSFPVIKLPSLPPNTIVPEDESLFIPYLNRLYEDIAFAVNSKDESYFPIAITSTASNIPNVPNFGAFIVCVSGEVQDTSTATGTGYLPTLTASLCKSSAAATGSIAVLGSQAGTGSWAGINLTITSTATNFQIAHSRAGVSGNFNIRFIGTQS